MGDKNSAINAELIMCLAKGLVNQTKSLNIKRPFNGIGLLFLGRKKDGGKIGLPLLISCLLFLPLSACKPRDVRLSEKRPAPQAPGSVLTKNKSGERLPTCRENSSSWSYLDIEPDQDVLIRSGQKSLMVRTGTFNCHEVGKKVRFRSNNHAAGAGGEVVIVQLALMNIADFEKSLSCLASKSGQTSEQLFAQVQSELDEKDANQVNITWFKYLPDASIVNSEYVTQEKGTCL